MIYEDQTITFPLKTFDRFLIQLAINGWVTPEMRQLLDELLKDKVITDKD